MPNNYSQRFSLADIFLNEKVKEKLPFFQEVSRLDDNGDVTSTRYKAKNGKQIIFGIAEASARPFFKHFKHNRIDNVIILGGDPINDDIDAPYEKVYKDLEANREFIRMYYNVLPILRRGLRREKNDMKKGKTPKLYLRLKKIDDLTTMNAKQLSLFMEDVMCNFMYNKDSYREFIKEKHMTQEQLVEFAKQAAKWREKVGYKDGQNFTNDI